MNRLCYTIHLCLEYPELLLYRKTSMGDSA